MRTLTADLNQRDDTIARFQKERKAMEELQQVRLSHAAHESTVFYNSCHIYMSKCSFHSQKTLDDLQAEEDKVNHLTKTNSKLTTQVHEVSLRARKRLTDT